MKFACEHCGRSYAVADELRGKTFKMKCRACGHVIVVKAEPAGKARGTAGTAEATPSPVTITGAPPGDEPAFRASSPEENPFVARPVSTATLGSRAADRQLDEPGAGLPPPPGEQYIDLVLDEDKVSEETPEPTEREPRHGSPPRRDGPDVPDPFADWRPLGEIEKSPLAAQVEPRHLRPPREVPPPIPTPRPRQEPWPEPPPSRRPAPEGLNPKVLIVAGGVAVAAVLVLLFVFVGRGGKAPGATVAATAERAPAPSPAPAPPTPVAAAPQPPPVPAAAEPIPALAEPEPQREEQPKRRAEPAPRKPKPAKVAREERRPEPKLEPTRRAPAPAPAPEPPRRQAAAPTATPSASGAAPKAAGQLTPQQVARIVSANKRAFEQCIAESTKRDPGLELAGRQVTLMLTVSPNGKVAYPTLDDVELNKTDLGACIKSAARIMMFPTFEGEPMKVEVPLSLGR